MRFTLACAALALSFAASTPALAIEGVQAGLWQLSESDGANGGVRRLCVDDPSRLNQLRHPGAICPHRVLASDAASTTVQYSCPGAGTGRTTIRRESSTLLHVKTQGIADRAPFDLDFEARRVGDCPRV